MGLGSKWLIAAGWVGFSWGILLSSGFAAAAAARSGQIETSLLPIHVGIIMVAVALWVAGNLPLVGPGRPAERGVTLMILVLIHVAVAAPLYFILVEAGWVLGGG